MGGVILKWFNANSTANAQRTDLKQFHGKTLAQVIGASGASFFTPLIGAKPVWSALGYPAVPPTGERMRRCISPLHDFVYIPPLPPLPVILCDMKKGSSGGPWLLPEGGKYYMNGVSSFYIGPRLGSPYFDEPARKLVLQLRAESP